MNSKLLQRILTYKQRPDIAKALTVEELTTAFADLFAVVRATNEAIEAGKLKGDAGYSPQADKDFMSMETAQRMLQAMFSDANGKVDAAVEDGLKAISNRLSEVRDGLDAEITDAHLEEAARRASLLVEMPDFGSLITAEPSAIRNALELLRDEDRIDIKAVRGWDEIIEGLRQEIQNIAISKGSGGGLGRRQVLEMINQNGSGVSDGDKGDITVAGDTWTINDAAVQMDDLDASGTASGATFLRGDGAWATPTGSGDVSKDGTPVDNQVGVWTGDGTIEGNSGLTYDGTALGVTGNITPSGTVDGRDVATDGTKLDGIEANAKDDQNASEVPFTANGDITSTDVQAALVEVRDDTDTKLAGKSDVGHTHVIGDVTNLQSSLDAKVDDTEVGAANGVATLDAGGKVPSAQLPNSVMEYLGTWAASTNTPTLTDGTGNAGDVYVASDAGTVNFGAGNITFAAGDWVIYSGTVWEKSINSNAVASVASKTGAVTLEAADIASGTFVDARIAESNVTQHQAAIDHDSLSGFVANEHIDWTTDQGGTDISAANIPDLSATYESADATILKEADVDDVPVNGATVAPVSSNWAFDHEADTSTHGVTGAIVGTTDTQTLTNKDVTASTNKLRDSKTISIESPTASEDISFFFTNKAITVSEIRAVLVGSSTPSVTWTVRHGTDRSAAGAEVVTSGTVTTSTTTGSDVTSFNDATIVADSHVWIETTAQSGTVDSLVITVFYDED